MKTRALIVDDEALARSRLRKMLDRESDVAVIGFSMNTCLPACKARRARS